MGLWIPMGVVVGWFVLCLVFVPPMVRIFVGYHAEFTCNYMLCTVNKGYKARTDEITIAQACSARRVHAGFLTLPFLMLSMIPRSLAFEAAHKIRDNEQKVKRLEAEAKQREAELITARALEANQTREAMRDFDKLMKMVEDGTVKV